MTILAQLIADRLVLKATRHPVSALGKQRLEIPFRKGHLEAWTQTVTNRPNEDADFFVLKFAGTGGRAERSTYHPMDYWSDLNAELWSVNMPGYGGSTGSPSLKTMPQAAATAFEAIQEKAQGRPIIIMGNSLGTVSALFLAARYDVAGVILRNPPPLRQLIVGKFGWWNLWVGAMIIAQKVPKTLCAIRNAEQSSCPAVILSSQRDQIVPTAYQNQVIEVYSAPKRLLHLWQASHATPLSLAEQREYRDHMDWLRGEIISIPESNLSVASR